MASGAVNLRPCEAACLVATLAMVLAGCYRPAPISADRALRLWRASARPTGSPTAGSAALLGLTERKAIELALRHNPDLLEARAGIAVAEALIGESTQIDNPDLRVRNVELKRILQDRPELEMALRVPLPHWAAVGFPRQEAALELQRALARISDLELKVAASVRKLFAELAMARADRAQGERSIAVSERYRLLVEQRVVAGADTRLVQATAALRSATTHDMEQAIAVKVAAVEEQLRRLIGLAPRQQATFIAEAGDAPVRELRVDEESLTARALTRRPDLREAATRVQLAESKMRLERATRWPSLSFAELSYRFAPGLDSREFSFSVAIDLPLLSWNRGAIARREAELSKRLVEERAVIEKTVHEVSGAVAELKRRAARLEQMRRLLLPAVEESTAVSAQAMESGVVDPLQSIVIEERETRARRDYLKAILEYKLGLIDLEMLVGGPIAPVPK